MDDTEKTLLESYRAGMSAFAAMLAEARACVIRSRELSAPPTFSPDSGREVKELRLGLDALASALEILAQRLDPSLLDQPVSAAGPSAPNSSGGGGPSDAAVDAVLSTYATKPLAASMPGTRAAQRATMRERLLAAHDPALGLDRSICLREVVEALRTGDLTARAPNPEAPSLWAAADWIERSFGGQSG